MKKKQKKLRFRDGLIVRTVGQTAEIKRSGLGLSKPSLNVNLTQFTPEPLEIDISLAFAVRRVTSKLPNCVRYYARSHWSIGVLDESMLTSW